MKRRQLLPAASAIAMPGFAFAQASGYPNKPIRSIVRAPEQFGQCIRSDIAGWTALAKARNMHLDD